MEHIRRKTEHVECHNMDDAGTTKGTIYTGTETDTGDLSLVHFHKQGPNETLTWDGIAP